MCLGSTCFERAMAWAKMDDTEDFAVAWALAKDRAGQPAAKRAYSAPHDLSQFVY